MKKVKLSMLLLIALQLTFIGCSESNEDLQLEQSELLSTIKLKTTTDVLSDNMRKLGISKVNVANNGNRLEYNFETFRSFVYDGNHLSFNNRIIVDQDGIYSDIDHEFKISINNAEVVISSPKYE